MHKLTDKQFAAIIGSIGILLQIIAIVWFLGLFAVHGTNYNHDPEIAIGAIGAFGCLGAIALAKGVSLVKTDQTRKNGR